MSNREKIALLCGGIVTAGVFLGAFVLLLSGDSVAQWNKLFYASIALAPVAMVAVMMGYAVWWLAMFLLTLFSVGSGRPEKEPEA